MPKATANAWRASWRRGKGLRRSASGLWRISIKYDKKQSNSIEDACLRCRLGDPDNAWFASGSDLAKATRRARNDTGGRPMNHAFRMKLKPGNVAEYRRRHDAIWPELAQLLRESGIYDYSIFLDEETLQLFAVLKLRDGNTREHLPQHPLMRRWWEYMRDLMETQPDGRPLEWPLVPLFHLD
jgi:L-rhamnose mutarotase